MTAPTEVQTIAAEVERNISAVFEQLKKRDHDTDAAVAEMLGCDPQTLGRKRRNERKWDAWEVRALADRYDMPVSVFYGGVAALFGGVQRSGITPTKGENAGVMLSEDESFWGAASLPLGIAV